MKENRSNFFGKLGVIAVATSPTVGLGNIWRFPHIGGQNGGGAILSVSDICIFNRCSRNAVGICNKLQGRLQCLRNYQATFAQGRVLDC